MLGRIAELPERDIARALSALRGAEFIYEEALYPEPEYTFKHPLTHQVAYESQLGARRARTHAAVARAISELETDRLDEEAALIAHHWKEAGEKLEAARWHRRAARWAGVSDPEEAFRHWSEVRALITDAEASTEMDALGVEACCGILIFGWRLGGSGETGALLAQGKALAERSGDQRGLAILYNAYGNVVGAADDLREYCEYAREASRLADETGEPGVRVALAADFSVALWWIGSLEEALRVAGRSLRETKDPSLGYEVLDIPPYIQALWVHGASLMEMGQIEEGARALKRAVALCEPAWPEWEIFMRTWQVILADRIGSAEGSLTHGRRALDLSERLGGSLGQVMSRAAFGLAHLLNGDWGAAVQAEEEALEIAREKGVGFIIPCYALTWLAEAQLALGNQRQALKRSAEALSEAERMGSPLLEIGARLTRTRVLLHAEERVDSPRIQEDLARASARIEDTGARSYTPAIHEIAAELALRRGDEAGRDRELREAHRLFAETGAAGHAGRVARELET